jgi:hypothetical protein
MTRLSVEDRVCQYGYKDEKGGRERMRMMTYHIDDALA